MKLSREELKDISAGATAVEYNVLILAFILKVIAFIKNLLSGSGTGGGGGGDDGSGGGDGGGQGGGGG